jgi:hypothetical protein
MNIEHFCLIYLNLCISEETQQNMISIREKEIPKVYV